MQLSLFDDRDLAEIASARLSRRTVIVCRNRELAAERVSKRGELLDATGERTRPTSQAAVARKRDPLRGKDIRGVRHERGYRPTQNGQALRSDHRRRQLPPRRNEAKIAAEAALDGLYVIRPHVSPRRLLGQKTLSAPIKISPPGGARLPQLLKTAELWTLRPIYHWLSQPRAALCSCACLSITWNGICAHKLAPMLFDDDDKEGCARLSTRPLSPKHHAWTTPKPRPPARTIKFAGPVHSFHTLMANLGTLCLNEVVAAAIPITCSR